MSNSYFYSETAFHHQGDYDYLISLIDASKNIGVNGVKFQVLTNAEDFISKKHSAFKDLKSYCFSLQQWKNIFKYTKQKKLDIILMPLNVNSLQLTRYFDIKYIDIHSVSFNDSRLLYDIKNTNLEIILGVGGRTIEEITEKIIFFENKVKILMVGFQSFPSDINDIKLSKIFFLKNNFHDLKIGYADHSSYNDEFCIKSNEYARLLGATIFEKHITLYEGEERIDYASANSPEKIKLIIEKVRFIESSILLNFESAFQFSEKEKIYRERQLRCVAKKNIAKGSVLTNEMISLKMVDNSNGTFNKPEQLIGRKILVNLAEDDVIKNENLKS